MWLVIGYGSSLNTDDRFGIVVAEELKARIAGEDVEVVSTLQLNPELIEAISKADGVIFVDASVNLPAGKVECISLGDGGRELGANSVFSHHLTPETLLQTVCVLYGDAPPGWIYAVGGEDFGWGEQLSPSVAMMVPRVAELILSHMHDHRLGMVMR